MGLVTPERIEYLRSTLTKEFFELEYPRLKTFKGIADHFGIPKTCVRRYATKVGFDYIHNKRGGCIDNFFSYDTEESFYIAGIFAADACLGITKIKGNAQKNKPGKHIYFGLASKDRDLVLRIKNILKIGNPILDKVSDTYKTNSRYKSASYCSSFKVTSEMMFDDLGRFGLTERKSLIVEFPQWIIDHPLCHHFMRGYFDGDCCVGIRYNKNKAGENTKTAQVFISGRGTEQFLTTMISILSNKLGIKKANTRLDSGIHQFMYSGNGVTKKIADYLYKDATIYLQRKYDIATSQYGPTPMTATQHKLQYLIDNNFPLPV